MNTGQGRPDTGTQDGRRRKCCRNMLVASDLQSAGECDGITIKGFSVMISSTAFTSTVAIALGKHTAAELLVDHPQLLRNCRPALGLNKILPNRLDGDRLKLVLVLTIPSFLRGLGLIHQLLPTRASHIAVVT